jgi:hypothetical protein
MRRRSYLLTNSGIGRATIKPGPRRSVIGAGPRADHTFYRSQTLRDRFRDSASNWFGRGGRHDTSLNLHAVRS